MSATSFAAALAAVLRADPSRPFVTFYDDATGERIELSAATYANWVAKTAGLAQDELDAERGGLLLLDLPAHWLTTVWLGAAWSLGLVVTDDPTLADDADLVVCGPDDVATYASHATRVPVVALSLRPLGGRFVEELPTGVTDFGAVVLAQPDAFVAHDPPSGDDVAWHDGPTQAALLAEAAGSDLVAPGGRLLTDRNPGHRADAAVLTAPLVRDAGLVLVRHPDPDGWDARTEQERATDVARASGQHR